MSRSGDPRPTVGIDAMARLGAQNPDADLRATLLDTVALCILFGVVLLLFSSFLIRIAFELGKYLSGQENHQFLSAAVSLICLIAICTFIAAQCLGSFIFSVHFDRTGLSYRDGFRRYAVASFSIEEICFLTSLREWRYIVIRAGGITHGLPNLLWSQADFARLEARIVDWHVAGGFGFPITSADTFSDGTTGELWWGSKKLPRQYRRYLLPCAALFAVVSLLAFLIGLAR